MKYPQDLKKNDTIGMIAPSFGIWCEPYITRYESAKNYFVNQGYKIKECPSVYGNYYGSSNTKEIRAKEFMDMYLDEEVDALFSVAGGEVMMDILNYLDFDALKKEIKYFVGYSDNTCLTFLLTTINNVATVYGQNVPPFGMMNLDECLIDQMLLLKGEKKTFLSYEKYQINDLKDTNPLASFNKTEEVKYKSFFGNHVEGIALGGCLDVLVHLVGTKYDYVKEFAKDKKILWYLEGCELSPTDIYRCLWTLKNAGWFLNASGFIFGRVFPIDDQVGINYETAILSSLSYMELPIIINADIGHLPPTIPVLNGAYLTVDIENEKGVFTFEKR